MARLSKTPVELMGAFKAAEKDTVDPDPPAGRITAQEAAIRNLIVVQAAVPRVLDDHGDRGELGDRYVLA